MKLINITTAARLLGVNPGTLRRYETPDGAWTEIYGFRLRVYRIGFLPSSQRRYNEDEIHRILARMQKVR